MDIDCEVRKIVTATVLRYAQGNRPLRATDHFRHDLGLDSLGVLEVMADVEEHCRVIIPTERLGSLSTIDELTEAVLLFMASQSGPCREDPTLVPRSTRPRSDTGPGDE